MATGQRAKTMKKLLVSLLTGTLLLALAAVIVAPSLEPVFMGVRYAELASVPVGELGRYRYEGMRMLTPAIGGLLHFGGEAWIWFPLIIAALFLATVHHFFGARGLTQAQAAGATALIAFAVPISWTLVFPGYIDTSAYLILLLAFVQVYRRSHTWALFFALGPLNHEAALFLAPALLALALVRAAPEQRLGSGLIWTGLFAFSLVPTLVARAWLRQSYGEMVPDELMKDLVGRQLVEGLPTLGIGLFMAFKFTWILPVVLGVIEHRAGGLRMTWVVLTVLVCTLSQLLFATDTTRLMAPAFLAIILCTVELRKHLAAQTFNTLVWGLVATNIVSPQLFSVPQGIVVCQPLPVALILADQGRHNFHRPLIFSLPVLYPSAPTQH